MGWIPKNPLPHDFCGRPPCGLCYVWQNDATDEIIEAVDHMLTELLGEGVTATDEQRATVEAAVRRIHEDNIRRNAEPDPPPDLDAGAAAFTEADNRRRLEMQLNYAAKLKAKADAYKPVMRNKSIDELGVSEAVLKEIEAQRDKSLTAERMAAESMLRQAQEAVTKARQAELDAQKVKTPTPFFEKNYLQTSIYKMKLDTTEASNVIIASIQITPLAMAQMMGDGSMRLVMSTGATVSFNNAPEALAYIVKNVDPNFAETFKQFAASRKGLTPDGKPRAFSDAEIRRMEALERLERNGVMPLPSSPYNKW